MTIILPQTATASEIGCGLGGDFDLSQHFTSLKSLVALTATTESEEVQEPYTID